jgi:hypothetical protein
MIYQFFWQRRLLTSETWIYVPVAGLVFTEITWALTFWPTGFVPRGMVLFVLFYCFVGLVRLYIGKNFVFNTVKKYLIVSAIVLSLVLGTTKWFF